MATQSFEQLIAGANKIKTNELPESNTASLVGEQLIQMVNKQSEEHSERTAAISKEQTDRAAAIKAEQDARIKGTTEYNVSVQHPTGGISGTNKYTLETAIQKIPAELRTVGIKCSFVGEDSLLKTYIYKGGHYTTSSNWELTPNQLQISNCYQTPFLKNNSDKVFNPSNIIIDIVYANNGLIGSDLYISLIGTNSSDFCIILIKNKNGEVLNFTKKKDVTPDGIGEVSSADNKLRLLVDFVELKSQPVQVYTDKALLLFPEYAHGKSELLNMVDEIYKYPSFIKVEDGFKPIMNIRKVLLNVSYVAKDIKNHIIRFQYVGVNGDNYVLFQLKDETTNKLLVNYVIKKEVAPDTITTIKENGIVLQIDLAYLKGQKQENLNKVLLITALSDTNSELQDIVAAAENKFSDINYLNYVIKDENAFNQFPDDVLKSGAVLGVYQPSDKEFQLKKRLKCIAIRNIANNASGAMIQFYDEETDFYYQYYNKTESTLNRGIQTYALKDGRDTHYFFIIIDWDKLANKTFSNFYINTTNIPEYQIDKVLPRLGSVETKVGKLTGESSLVARPVCLFGDVLPATFKDKMMSLHKDIEILLVGDSITGLLNENIYMTEKEAQNFPPGMNSWHWTHQLYENILHNRPVSKRVDSIISKSEGWQLTQYEDFNGAGNVSSYFGEHSHSTITCKNNNNNSFVTFEWNLSMYEKASIPFTRAINGAKARITISSGDNKILVSTDKESYVEANNFTFDESTNPSNLPDEELVLTSRTNKTALYERHRRLWFKKVSKDSAEKINITITKIDKDASKYLYVWGIQMWNGCTIFVTNLGRGGRTTKLLGNSMSDVINRNPDFVLFEMPLINESTSASLLDIQNSYNEYFFGVNRSIKEASANFTKWQYLVMMPHGTVEYFKGNEAVYIDMVKLGCTPYNYFHKMFGWFRGRVKEEGFDSSFAFVNMYDAIINEIHQNGMTTEDGFKKSNYTYDGTHPNKRLSNVYAKYLSPIFM